MNTYKVYRKFNNEWNTLVGSVKGELIDSKFTGHINSLKASEGITKGKTYQMRKESGTVLGRYFCKKGGVKTGAEVLLNKVSNIEEEMSLAMYQGVAATGTDYKVNITMTPDTVQALLNAGFNLYGFKAVQATNQGGAPLVWFKTDVFSVDTEISWVKEYEAYTSRSEIISNGQITASFSTDITLGQTLNVESGGVGSVVNGGPATAISIFNTTSTQFTCGISEEVEGQAKPLCAFPLFGNNLDVIAPIEKVLLLFSTNPVNTGTVIMQAYGPGVLIDLTSSNERNVSYDINQGWSWGGFSWAQQVAANANLVPLLIETSGTSQVAFQRRSLVET